MATLLKKFGAGILWCLFLLMLVLQSGCVSPIDKHFDENARAIRQEVAKVKAQQQASLKGQEKSQQSAMINNFLQPNYKATMKDDGAGDVLFDLSVSNMAARSFFLGLVKGTPYSMVMDPAVAGTITLHLKQVNIAKVLEVVHDIYGYEIHVTDYGYLVEPPKLQTKIFTIDYLDVTRKGTSSMSVTGSGISKSAAGNAQVSSQYETNFWPELEKTINALIVSEYNIASSGGFKSSGTVTVRSRARVGQSRVIGSSGSSAGDKQTSATAGAGKFVLVNPDSGIVMVRAFPHELRMIKEYLKLTQEIIQRQVVLEAKILEVQLNKEYSQGINWNLFNKLKLTGPETPSTFPKQITKAAFTSGGDFAAAVSILSGQGQVTALSSPRVATLNNQKAVIKVGYDKYYVINLKNTTQTTSGTDSTAQEADLQPFFNGVALDITPQISEDGDVILQIHPIISRIQDDTLKYTVNGEVTEITTAQSSLKESDSIIRVPNGQIAILGGLIDTESSQLLSGLPDNTAPGKLFNKTLGHKTDQYTRTELVILIKPIVANSGEAAPIGEFNTFSQKIRSSAYAHKVEEKTMPALVPKSKGKS